MNIEGLKLFQATAKHRSVVFQICYVLAENQNHAVELVKESCRVKYPYQRSMQPTVVDLVQLAEAQSTQNTSVLFNPELLLVPTVPYESPF